MIDQRKDSGMANLFIPGKSPMIDQKNDSGMANRVYGFLTWMTLRQLSQKSLYQHG